MQFETGIDIQQFEKSQTRLRVLALATAALAACGGAWAAESSPSAEGWAATCPAGFAPQAGLNSGFYSDGAPRQFHVLLPDCPLNCGSAPVVEQTPSVTRVA